MSEHECIVSLIHLVNVVVHSSCNALFGLFLLDLLLIIALTAMQHT